MWHKITTYNLITHIYIRTLFNESKTPLHILWEKPLIHEQNKQCFSVKLITGFTKKGDNELRKTFII